MKPEGPELGRKVQPDRNNTPSKAETSRPWRKCGAVSAVFGKAALKRLVSESCGATKNKLPHLVVAPRQDHP